MMDFTGKTTIITGGGSGIGRAAALKFAGLHAAVAIVDINEENGSKVVNEVKELGSEALFIKTDISNFEQTRAMAGKVQEKFGKIDVLVNNAGVDWSSPFHSMDETRWREIIEVNFGSGVQRKIK
jgi:NAD(P)-dependent dehydrogenase (short-subunit alcohol dehydrogenase family)